MNNVKHIIKNTKVSPPNSGPIRNRRLPHFSDINSTPSTWSFLGFFIIILNEKKKCKIMLIIFSTIPSIMVKWNFLFTVLVGTFNNAVCIISNLSFKIDKLNHNWTWTWIWELSSCCPARPHIIKGHYLSAFGRFLNHYIHTKQWVVNVHKSFTTAMTVISCRFVRGQCISSN